MTPEELFKAMVDQDTVLYLSETTRRYRKAKIVAVGLRTSRVVTPNSVSSWINNEDIKQEGSK